MNKTAVYLTFALALISLVYSFVSSGLITASVNLAFSGTVRQKDLNNEVIFSNGFESGTFSAFTTVNGAPTIITNPVHSGTYVMSCNASGSGVEETLFSSYSDLFTRFYVYFSTIPSTSNIWQSILYIEDSNWAKSIVVSIVDQSGTTYWNLATPNTSTSIPATINAGQWYCVEIERKVGTGNAVASLWIDDVNIVNITTENMTVNSQIVDFYMGTSLTTVIDDVVVADAYNGPLSAFYYITVSSDSNSIISPSGVTAVSGGCSQGYFISASAGYSISSVLVDGVNQGPIVSYTFLGVQSNHTISVSSAFTANSELNNVIVIYGAKSLNDTEITFVASHFNMLICDLDMEQSTLQSLKTLNPNILIFGYSDICSTTSWQSFWATVDANEDWFLHDIDGNRIVFSGSLSYIMDNTSGWKQFYSFYVNSELNNTLFDGVFADNVWNQLSDHLGGSLKDASTDATLTSSDISSSTISNWHSNTIDILQYVEDNIISGKKVIANIDEYLANDYLNVVDGRMDEGFAYANWWGGLNIGWFNPIDHINAMARDSATEKIIVAESGVAMPTTLDSTTLAEIAQNANYCYVATLLGMNGENCYFGYTVGYYYTYTGETDYMPTLITNLGSPSGSYYQSQNIYIRNFGDGIVLFNPSGNSYDINLGNNYQLTNGTIVSSIVLDPWSGEILLSVA